LVAGRREIAVFNVGGTLHALFNRCPHQQAPLSFGDIGSVRLPSAVGEFRQGPADQALRCPWHAYAFDLRDGRCLSDPGKFRVARYEVAREGDEIAVYV
jgi:nitrite reductase/ring-hydroxylating ferredoxin subunit